MSANDDLRGTLAALVAAQANPPCAPSALDDLTPLFAGGLEVDSVGVLELVVSLEERFGVTLSAEEVGGESFATFGRLLALVAGRRASDGGAIA